MKTIKLIDLLNMIAKGEIPKKIKHKSDIWNYKKLNEGWCYILDGSQSPMLSFEYFIEHNKLHDEIEIIEESEPAQIEKINLDDWVEITYRLDNDLLKQDFNKNTNTFVTKINELIDVVNELKKGSDNNE